MEWHVSWTLEDVVQMQTRGAREILAATSQKHRAILVVYS